jgi:hypothetical protein
MGADGRTGRIVARWEPQAWVNDSAMGVDGGLDFDVTRKVLCLPLADVQALKDGSRASDTLAWGEKFYEDHDGPFRVESAEAICEFFGVDSLDQITERMLMAARRREREAGAKAAALAECRSCGNREQDLLKGLRGPVDREEDPRLPALRDGARVAGGVTMARTRKQPKAADLIKANPVLAKPGFQTELDKWEAARDEGERLGLRDLELAAFIARKLGKE